jgi:hypothetical protein
MMLRYGSSWVFRSERRWKSKNFARIDTQEVYTLIVWI